MTSPEPMSREDLVELAALDAFGLLDQYEAALYTRSFHHAPAAVQDEILELQEQIAASPVLLSDESPSSELREKVLTAVARAIELEHTRLAPIASIGGYRRTGERGQGATESPRRARPLFGGSGPFWRAAAFVLCGAVIVLAYFQVERQRQYDRMWEVMLNDLTQSQVAEMIGPDFAFFVGHPRKRVLPLRSIGGDGTGFVAFIEPQVGDDATEAECFVLTIGLPKSSAKYQLRVCEPDAEPRTIGPGFISNGMVGALQLGRFSTDLLATATFEIVDASGVVVLTT